MPETMPAAFVTGGARGIGEAVARRLASDGWAVAVADLDEPAAVALAAVLQADGARAAGVAVDVADYAAVEAAVEQAEAALGPMTAVVNNAGWDRLEPFLDNEPSLWDRLIAVNLRGPINVSHVLGRRLAAQGTGGRMVNVSSDAARVGSTGEAVYAACKAGVIGLTKSLARELARHGVTVNAVCPGPTETRLLDEVRTSDLGAKVMRAIGRTIPLGRFGAPADVANAVAYFVADDAAFVTGQVLSVSGGLTMAG
jgi:2-hydroxycyclohexanecarboxyl-CoA dehydrogenase